MFSTRPTREPARSRGLGAERRRARAGIDVGSKSFMAILTGVDDGGDAAGPLVAPARQQADQLPAWPPAQTIRMSSGRSKACSRSSRRPGSSSPGRRPARLRSATVRRAWSTRKARTSVLAPAARAQESVCSPASTTSDWLKPAQVGRAEMAESIGEAAEQGLRRRGELVVDLVEAVRGVDGDGALLGSEPALDVEGLPRVSHPRSRRSRTSIFRACRAWRGRAGRAACSSRSSSSGGRPGRSWRWRGCPGRRRYCRS